MPVRKIPKNYRSVTGTFPSLKNNRNIGYESLLERDFFILQEFDKSVLSYEEQPFSINYLRNNRSYRYTPDCLVHYYDPSILPCVFEIKFSDEIKSQKVFFEDKFKNLESYLNQNDMNFKLFTELQIRDVFLDNAKFLYRYAFMKIDHRLDEVLSLINTQEEISVSDLLVRVSNNKYVQVEYLPFIWFSVFQSKLEADLNNPLNNNTILRCKHND